MFLRYFVELSHSAATSAGVLTGAPTEWLSDAVQDSLGAGSRLSAEVGLNLGQRRVHRLVDVQLGTAVELAGVTVIPIRWTDHSHAGLFPRFDADLEIASLGEHRCQLAISVRYQPPLGVIGAIADRALMHRVAEATVKDFLDRVAKRVDQQITRREAVPS